MIAVLVHVGQTPKVCGGRCPIFADGTFKFVPIAVRQPRPRQDPSFRELGLADFVPAELHDYPAFRSPEFDTNTYSHIPRPGEGKVYERLRKEKGFLFFFSTLYYWDESPPNYEWVSKTKGAYIIGYFRVEGIYTDEELESSTSLQARFRDNGQFERRRTPGKRYLWISGFQAEGGLLRKAVPLTEPTDPSKWNEFARRNLFTTGGKSLADYPTARYNWTLLCLPSNLPHLFRWINRYNPHISKNP